MLLTVSGVPSGLFYCQKHQSWQPIENEMNCCEQEEEVKLIDKAPLAAFIPMGFAFNDPTNFLLTMFGVGIVAVVAEFVLSDTNYYEQVHNFRVRYVKYVYPVSVVATGVWAFAKVVKIML